MFNRIGAARRRQSLGNLLVVALLAATLVFLPGAPAAAAGPFVCDGTPYTMQSGDLYQTLPDPANPGQYIAVLISDAAIGNALAYDPTTNYLYAIKRSGNTTNRVFRVETYDNVANVVNTQTLFPAPGSPPLPNTGNVSSYSGTALGDGRYIIGLWRGDMVNPADGNTYSDYLWSVDAATGEATLIGPTSPQSPRHADFSYNPADGYMYQAVSGNLWRIDPLTGVQVDLGAVAGLPGGAFGSSWFSASGLLYVQRNSDGQIYEIDLGAMTAADVGATGATGGADGASCVGSLDLLKDVVDVAGNPVPLADRIYRPGETVRYEFTLVNNALPTGPRTLNLCDVLPADGRTYTGAWAVDPPATVVNAATTPVAGSTSFCASINVPSSLFTDPATPGSPPVKFTVDVLVGAYPPGGIVENQGWIDTDGNPATKEVLSDDPGDPTDPEDPTTIEILRPFEVRKTIRSHPDGNTTDSFTITVSCVDADGAPYDIDAADIVDAATGLPWPSAGTNTFQITDAQNVDVYARAGSTCTTTETLLPGYAPWMVRDSDGLRAELPASPVSTIVLDTNSEWVRFWNYTGPFTLYKQTIAPTGALPAPLDMSAAFTFEVTCRQGGVVVFGPETYSITPTNPSGSGMDGSLSYPDTDLVPHKASCEVTETVPPGWEVVTANPNTFSNGLGDDQVTFQNRPLVGSLTVTKAIEGLPPDADPADFTFQVTVTCSGGFETNPAVLGPYDLVAGTPLVINNLPAVASCVVAESPTSAFGPSYSPAGGKVNITVDGAQVDITNTTGTFVIEKFTTAPAGVDATGDFAFTISCDNGYSGTHTVSAENPAPGGATGGLGYAELPLLPPGTICVVAEVGPPDGWVLDSDREVKFEVPADGVRPTAVFRNSRDVADLKITKVVAGDSPDNPLNAELFDVTVTCNGPFDSSPAVFTVQVSEDAPATIPDLPVGATCQAVEAPDPRFTTTVPDTGKVVIADGASVEFTNSTSWFEITKKTRVNSTHPVEDDATFTVNVRCDNGYSDMFTLTTVNGGVVVGPPDVPYLPPGTSCDFTEVVPDGWTLVGDATITGVTEVDDPATPGFGNRRDLVDLTIDKKIVGLPASEDPADYAFTVDISCTGGFEVGSDPYVINDVPLVSGTPSTIAGLPIDAVCTVTEDPTAAFAASYTDGAVVTLGETGGAVTITNTTSTIAINKTTVVPAGSTVDPDDTFGFGVVCTTTDWTGTVNITTSGGTGSVGFPTLPLLAPGTSCVVDETTIPMGWSVTATPLTITTVGGATTSADFTNTRETSALTVTKTIDGLPASEDPDSYDFTADISCTGDFSPNPMVLLDQPLNTATPLVISDVPTGAICTVTEDPDPTFTAYYSPSSTVTVGADGANVGVLNSTGEFIVLKHSLVDDTHPISPIADFTFQIRCTLGGTVNYDETHTLSSDSVTADGSTGGISYGDLPSLAAGTECLITETGAPPGWTIDTAPQTLTLTPDAPATAQFQNTRELGALSFTKTVEGLPASATISDYSFIVNVVCNGGGLPADYALGPYNIKHGETITIPNLPTLASCVVTEQPDARFAATYANNPATIDTDGEVVPITNATGTFDLTKTALNPGALTIDLDETFTFVVDCDNGYSANHTVSTNTGGTGSTVFPVIPLLAAGTSCDVTEQGPPAGWILDTDATVTVPISATDTPAAAFTNSRDLGSLEITKTVVGLPAAATVGDYSFVVDVVCNGGGLPTDFAPGPFTVSHGDSVTVADLPVGATCAVSEQADSAFAATYANTPATIDSDGELVPITNATGTFDLVKDAQNPGATAVDLTETFTFGVVCSNGYSANHTVTTNAAGAGSTVFPTIPLLAAGTTCAVTEQGPPTGWTLGSAGTVSVDIMATETGVARFVNTRDLGELGITKAIEGLPAGADPDSFTFTVDVTCNGPGLPIDYAAGPFTIKVGETVTVPDLPTGASCAVVEQYSDQFTPSYVNNPATIDVDGEVVPIINSTGELIVEKTATIDTTHPVDLTETFTFRIVCVDPTGATVYNELDDVSVAPAGPNTAFGGIRYDQLPIMPNGTDCSITEQTPPTGWTLASDETVDVTIDQDEPVTAAFINTRDTGNLDFSKEVAGLPAGVSPADFSFTVDVTCNGGGLPTDYAPGPFTIAPDETITVPNLPTGAVCSVVEQADDRFATSYSNTPATIDTDGELVPILNETGTFDLTKLAVNPASAPVDLSGTFEFPVGCDNGYESQHTIVTTAAGIGGSPTLPIPLLPAGTVCVINELSPGAGWVATPATAITLTISISDTPEAAFVNTRDVSDLTITKTIQGLPASADPLDWTFTVDVVCNGGGLPADYTPGPFSIQAGDTLTVPGLPTGAVCEVIERYSDEFTPTYANTPATMDADGETVAITNSTGELIVSKTATITTAHPVDLTETFTFRIVCEDPTGATIYDELQPIAVAGSGTNVATGGIRYDDLPIMPDGTSCAITEQTPPAGWTQASDETVNVTIDNDAPVTAGFENTRDVGDLTLTKTVLGLPASATVADYTFTVDVVCNGGGLPADYEPGPYVVGHGDSVIIDDLPVGAVCSVTEQDDDRFAASYANNPATIDAGGETVPVINETGSFDLTKTATNAGDRPVDLAGTFTFDVVCDNGYTGTHTVTTDAAGNGTTAFPAIPVLAAGTSCDVTEQTPPIGWTRTSPETVTVVSSATGTAEAAFTNSRDLGAVTITKSILGLPANAVASDYEFVVDIECSGGGLPAGYAAGPLTISDGGTVTVADLPTGAECEVTEQYAVGFTPSYTNTPVEVDQDGETVAIVNATGELIVAKTAMVTTDHPVDIDVDFTFQITCVDPAGNTVHDAIETVSVTVSATTPSVSGSPATTTATGGIRYDDLPIMADGTTCEITEQGPPVGWTLTSDPTVAVVVDSDAPVSAPFTNVRDVGDLAVSKVILGLPSSEDPTDWSFTVDVVCNGPDLPPDYAPGPLTISHGETLTIPDLPTGAVCAVTEQYTDEFQPTYQNAPATIDTDGETVAITNSTGELIVEKTATIDTTHPVDLTETFSFTVTCVDPTGATIYDETVSISVAPNGTNTATGGLSYDDLPIMANGTVCDISEQGPPAGWTLASDGTVEVTIDQAEPATAAFENTRVVGDLTLNKTITGLPADADPADYEFTLDVVCNGGGLPDNYTPGPFTIGAAGTIDGTIDGTIVVENLPIGAECVVAERPDDRFTATYENTPTVIDADGEAMAITNATGTLEVSKDARNEGEHPVDLSGTFEFDLACDNGYAGAHQVVTASDGAGAVSFPDLPLLASGTECTVTEVGPDAPWTGVVVDGEVEIASDGVAEVSLVNLRDVGDLTISKAVLGLPVGVSPNDFTFTLDVVCNGGDLPTDYEPGPYAIKHGQSVVVEDLPVGATCEVTEQDAPGFTATYDNNPTTIDVDGEQVGVVNATGELIVSKVATVPTDHPVDLVTTFDFAITCVDPTGTTVLDRVETFGVVPMGPGLATGGIGYDRLPIMPDGTVCSITEQGPATGWTLASAETVTVTIDNAAPATAEFTNTRDVGDLEITKTIYGLPAGSAPVDFSFTVDVVCNGGGLPDDYTPGPFIIGHSDPVTLENLPTGAECEVVERPTSGFTPTYVNTPTTIDTDGEVVGITNSTGEIIVLKVASVDSAHPMDLTASFDFELVCTNTSGVVVFDQIVPVPVTSTASTTATGGISYGDLPIMPDGSECVITELTPDAGWTLVSPETVTVVIQSLAPVTAVFNNERDVSDLELTKTVTGLPSAADGTDVFELNVTCSGGGLPADYAPGPYTISDGETVVVADLPTGALCVIDEVADDRYEPTITNSPASIDADGETVPVTNATGTFAIVKTAVNAGPHPVDLTGTFTFEVDCDNGYRGTHDVETDASGDGSITHPDLPLLAAGTTCDIAESDVPTGWVGDTGPQTVTIEPNVDSAAAFTNSRELGSVVISKAIEGLPAGESAAAFSFTVDVICNGGGLPADYVAGPVTIGVGSAATIADLPTGATCVATEQDDAQFTSEATPPDATVTVVAPATNVAGPGPGTPGTDVGAVVHFTNRTGTIEITKLASAAGEQPVTIASVVSFDVSCDNGYAGTHDVTTDATGVGSITHPDLPILAAGTTCAVTEVDAPDGWSLTSDQTQSVTVPTGAAVPVTFRNERDTAALTISKTVVGAPELMNESFVVDITCTGPFTGGSVALSSVVLVTAAPTIIPNLPTGAECSVIEQPDVRFSTSYSPAAADRDGAAVTITDDGATVNVINQSGSLAVLKHTSTTTDHPVDPSGVFTFDIVCANGGVTLHDASHEIVVAATAPGAGLGVLDTSSLPDLPDGSTCEVIETGGPDGWTVDGALSQTVTLTAGTPAMVEFTNTRDDATLTITKDIDGLPVGVAAAEFDTPFVLDVTCTGGDLLEDPYVMTGLVVTVNTPLVIDDLPTGATCSAIEESSDRFFPLYDDPVVIEDEGATWGVVNSAGSLIVSKFAQVESDHPIAAEPEFDFAIECIGPDGSEVYNQELAAQMDTPVIDGVVGGINYDRLPPLPTGTTCAIAEVNLAEHWTVVGSDSAVLDIAAGVLPTASFTNRRDVGDLEVRKVITDLDPLADAYLDRFVIDLECSGGFTEEPYVLTETISTDNRAVIEALPAGAECTISEQADARFVSTISTPMVTIGSDGDGEIGDGETSEVIPSEVTVENRRRTGSVSVVKELNGIPDDVDLSGALYNFTLSCEGDFAGGSSEIDLSAGVGTPAVVDLLPVGAECVLAEAEDERFAVAFEPEGPITIAERTGSQPNHRITAVNTWVFDSGGGGIGADPTATPTATPTAPPTATATVEAPSTATATSTATPQPTATATGEVAATAIPAVPATATATAAPITPAPTATAELVPLQIPFSDPVAPELAVTGRESGPLVAWALAAALMGFVLVLVARRKRHD